MARTCSIDGCPKPVHALGWCNAHHRRWHKTGDPLPTAASRCIPGDALPGERWLPVVGFPGYEVSDLGRVRRLMGHGATRLLRGKVVPDGYTQVALTIARRRRQLQVHRLVLTAFVGPCPDGLECCHGNGVPSDNRLRNLRWDTRVENWVDRKRHSSARR